MHERCFAGSAGMLHSPERLALLEIERVVSLCLEAFPAASVLDVGTGTGLFAKGFAAQGLKVAGIDVNPTMLETARRSVPQARFQHAPAEKIPYDETAPLIWPSWALSCTRRTTGRKPCGKPGGSRGWERPCWSGRSATRNMARRWPTGSGRTRL